MATIARGLIKKYLIGGCRRVNGCLAKPYSTFPSGTLRSALAANSARDPTRWRRRARRGRVRCPWPRPRACIRGSELVDLEPLHVCIGQPAMRDARLCVQLELALSVHALGARVLGQVQQVVEGGFFEHGQCVYVGSFEIARQGRCGWSYRLGVPRGCVVAPTPLRCTRGPRACCLSRSVSMCLLPVLHTLVWLRHRAFRRMQTLQRCGCLLAVVPHWRGLSVP